MSGPLIEFARRSLSVAAAALAAGAMAFTLANSGDGAAPAAALVLFTGLALAAGTVIRRQRTELRGLSGQLELASRDPLTGALNGGAFERTFTAWVGTGARRQLECSVLLLDVDGLGLINHVYGHEAGNAALRHLSEIVNDCIRETDAFGRLAGEEFGLLFPGTSGRDAVVVAERIRSAVARKSVEAGTGFTVSIGVTGSHAFRDPWAAAERGLALAKAAGQNRVVLAETETEAEPEVLVVEASREEWLDVEIPSDASARVWFDALDTMASESRAA